MKVKPPPKDRSQKRDERLNRLLGVPGTPLWLKILAFVLGALFVYLFIMWAIWGMQTVVIPDSRGLPRGQVTSPRPQ